MSAILVYVEHDGGCVTDLSLQCLSMGRSLSDQIGVKLHAVILGTAPNGVPAADVVHTSQANGLDPYTTRPHAHLLETLVNSLQPKALLLPSSTVGNDLAPRVAGQLGLAAALNCDAVELEEGELRFRRLEYDARAHTWFAPAKAGCSVITLADGIADPASGDTSGSIESLEAELPADLLGVLVERREVVQKTVNLKDAKVIIGGGAGVGTKENFALLEQLATRLGGEIGATRASVDAGWVSAERQIGQTGVVVRPDLYIACGISGAVQHAVGIRDARMIVAINTDPAAPIFKMAHYRIVGDLTVVIPKLLDLLG